MSTVRELDGSPSILPLYARAAAPLVPGASLLPFVPGRGSEIPDLELALNGVGTGSTRLAQYARVCGFTLRGTLPVTYPHVLAFPLHMALMADGRFPFGAVGLVHVSNAITQHRPIRSTEALDLRVRATPVEPHAKGRVFSIISEARIADQLVWSGTSTMLRRGKRDSDAPREERTDPGTLTARAEWRVPDDIGRRYGAVSGDRNPIHIHPLSARLFGFPRAIAHGMWTKARCLAALDARLPDAFTVEVAFRKPLLLPATVTFATNADGTAFAVRDRRKGTPHLDGRIST